MITSNGSTAKIAPVVTAQPSNQLNDGSQFCHEYHCPVRTELESAPIATKTPPTPHSQNAGGNANTAASDVTTTAPSQISVDAFRNVK